MAKSFWLTPEEAVLRNKRRKQLLSVIFVVATVIISALVTILANNI
ncbi:hypothetical protein J7E81_21605 [Bacillus sp. ISL-18]|nr:hypothetical protein [Bacillus sp. ISL-18]MBT2657801.1 hypothetical protein [Bacillus sp. ISL-18]